MLTLIDMRIDVADGEELSDTTLDVLTDIMDALSLLLVDEETKENAGIFLESKGYHMMLHLITSRPELRKKALKVISFGLTKCTQEQAVEFLESTKGLKVLFGLWMIRPEASADEEVEILSKDHSQLLEYLISTFWNLLSALQTQGNSSVDT